MEEIALKQHFFFWIKTFKNCNHRLYKAEHSY